MSNIHPTSIVDSQVQLADEVEIGPGCMLQGRITLGTGTRLIGNVYMQGPLNLGPGNTFYPFCCIGFAPQDWSFESGAEGAGLRIGANNIFRESVTVHRATSFDPDCPTVIGDGNYFMVGGHVGHDSVLGNRCVLANGVQLGGHVTLEDIANLAGGAMVHQFCRIGRLAMVGGLQALTQDAPPFCICHKLRGVSSLNIVGLRRAGLRAHIDPLKHAFDILFRGGHTNPHAVHLVKQHLGHDPLCHELAEFVTRTKRGITPYMRSKKAARETTAVN